MLLEIRRLGVHQSIHHEGSIPQPTDSPCGVFSQHAEELQLGTCADALQRPDGFSLPLAAWPTPLAPADSRELVKAATDEAVTGRLGTPEYRGRGKRLSEPFSEIELTQAVAVLRQQLVAAATAVSDQEPIFEVRDLTMEFSVELRKDAQAKAGFRAWVVSGESGVAVSGNRAHRVTLTLAPKNAADGGSWIIGNPEAADLTEFNGERQLP
ncbi:trypco2 family protein [Kitasatospora sp. NPDC006697]|uniref:trypco2 family protein n=1 Tax=Kitasatospora sp. NPDC006697 TaxID=3364020 RepID=UPI003685453D